MGERVMRAWVRVWVREKVCSESCVSVCLFIIMYSSQYLMKRVRIIQRYISVTEKECEGLCYRVSGYVKVRERWMRACLSSM